MYSVTEYQYQQLRNYYPNCSVVTEIGRQLQKESQNAVNIMKSKIYYQIINDPKIVLIFGANYIRINNSDLWNKITSHNLSSTHKLLAVVDETNLENIFRHFQGEVWSPDGEARELIRGLGLQHTSMSVGDMVQQDNKYYFCDILGWIEI